MPSVLGNLTHGSSTGKCVVANSLGSPLTLGGPDGNVEAVQFCGTNPGIVGAFEEVRRCGVLSLDLVWTL